MNRTRPQLIGVGILKRAAVSSTPNPSPVKREGLPEPFFPALAERETPSLRGEGAGVRGKTKYLPLKAAPSPQTERGNRRITATVTACPSKDLTGQSIYQLFHHWAPKLSNHGNVIGPSASVQ